MVGLIVIQILFTLMVAFLVMVMITNYINWYYGHRGLGIDANKVWVRVWVRLWKYLSDGIFISILFLIIVMILAFIWGVNLP